MKTMKKLLAVVLSVFMMAAMTVTAFAADAPTSGSVTVKNSHKGQTYTLYKLFDAEITFDDAGKQKAITYKLPSGKTLDTTGQTWFKVNSNGFIEKTEALTSDVMKTSAFITWAKSFGSTVNSPKTASADNAEVKWTGLDFGYYFVDSTLGSFIGVDSDNPNVEIEDKNNPPTLDKEITGVGTDKDTSSLGEGDDKTDPGQGANEKAIAQIGDPVNYKLTVTAKPGAENYVVTDTLSAGLTPPAASDVTVSAGAGNFSVDVTGQVITVTFTKAYLDSITSDTTITIKYAAVLNSSAVIGEAGNDNTAKLTWGHTPSSETNPNKTEDKAKVYTAQVEVNKKDDKGAPLANAGFVVKNSDNKYYKLDTVERKQVVTWVDDIAQADEHMSGTDGKVAAFTGLSNGTYTLVEKTVPAGYNKLEDTTFTIADKDYTNTNLKQTKEVTNQGGTTLPSTGGIGTTIFYTVGAILVIGAGVILVTRKRMSSED